MDPIMKATLYPPRTATYPASRSVCTTQDAARSTEDSVRFLGRYSPSQGEIAFLKQALTGWPQYADITGPEFLAGDSDQLGKTELLQAFLQTLPDTAPSHELVKTLALTKARVLNIYAIYLNRTVCTPQSLEHESRQFLKTMKEQVDDMKQVFSSRFDFDQAELSLLQSLIAHTAPALFAMNYPDAAMHSAQVAKLALYKAAEENADKQTLLQAAMVGWLHDPKLSSDISFNNLATHPVVASAIADSVLNLPSLKKELQSYFTAIGQARRLSGFTRGIVDALSINNDSKWVTTNVILPNLLKEIESRFGSDMAQELEHITLHRLESPGKGKKPQALPEPLIGALHDIRLETGLIGIRKSTLQDIAGTVSLDVLAGIMNGTITDHALVSKLHEALKARNGFIQCKVDALSMFSHHSEVIPSGATAALALVNADPLLLSPHKILQSVKPDVQFSESVTSFVRSFADNIRYLPKQSQAQAQPWQRAIYLALLKTADALTGGKQLEAFMRKNQSVTIGKQIERLQQQLIDPAIWGEYATLNGSAPLFQEGVSQIETDYLNMARLFRKASIQNDGSVKSLQ